MVTEAKPGLTEDDYDKLMALSEAQSVNTAEESDEFVQDPVDTAPARRTKAYSVSERLCEAIRDHLEDNGYLATANYFGLNVMTVKRHSESYTKRNCRHETGGIDAQRCSVMREMARDGWSQRELAEYFDIVRGTSRYHIIGQCACNHDTPPVTYDGNPNQEIAPSDCHDIRRLAHDGKSQREILDRYDNTDSKAAIRHHLKGECTCDVAMPAVTYTDEGVAVADASSMPQPAAGD
jgi:hypothetical protein